MPTATETAPTVQADGIEIVDYSEKAVAVFDDVKAIKDTLKGIGGRFNPALLHNGESAPDGYFPNPKRPNYATH